MTPEQHARLQIDDLLIRAGWSIQDSSNVNRYAGLGVAVREYQTTGGPVDYALFVNGKAIGVIEAKRSDSSLVAVDQQSDRYGQGFGNVAAWGAPLPFAYESNGKTTLFRDQRDPQPRSRRIFAVHSPESLHEMVQAQTLRSRLRSFSPLDPTGLRANQVEALDGLERSLGLGRQRSLIQAATGSGKTVTAITSCYRLLKHIKAKRVLFLVDRKNLGEQAEAEFKAYQPRGESQKFGQLYNVTLAQSGKIDPVNSVVISTIQRLYSILSGQPLEPELDNAGFEQQEQDLKAPPVEVRYTPDYPPDFFDFIVIDECHRSIYNKWRGVLEYFDAFLIGLTATPNKQTYGFFEQNVVSEYTHEHAVRDGVNVPYRVYRIKTQIGEHGSTVDAGYTVKMLERETRAERWERLDEDYQYDAKDLDRSVIAPDQIRTVLTEYQRALPELFPDRNEVPKTLIFAKDDAHADRITEIVREVFNQGNAFAQKITYKADDPTRTLSEFQFQYNPRIAITVDMISTGTDIKTLEAIVFLRDVKSLGYYDQMKGRGVRVIKAAELQQATPDAESKDYFVLVDAVGVTENPKVETGSTDREPSIPIQKLLERVQRGDLRSGTVETLATRLVRLEKRMTDPQRAQAAQLAGKPISELVREMFNACDPDIIRTQAEAIHADPTPAQIKQTQLHALEAATRPLAASQALREMFLKHSNQRASILIDEISQDAITYSGPDVEKAEVLLTQFKTYLETHKDEILALQIMYAQPYGERLLTQDAIHDLTESLRQNGLTSEVLWDAYAKLEPSKVRVSPRKQLTNIINLVRYAIGQRNALEPFTDEVHRKFEAWTQRHGPFTPEQLEWLSLIREYITESASINRDALKMPPFTSKGGLHRAVKLFPELKTMLDELNKELAA